MNDFIIFALVISESQSESDRLKQIWVPESVLGVVQCATSKLIVKYDQGFDKLKLIISCFCPHSGAYKTSTSCSVWCLFTVLSRSSSGGTALSINLC